MPATKTEITQSLTHAGGVVYREIAEVREFLVISAKQVRDEFVLPKGHLRPGELPESAAIREVREEAGVEAEIIMPLADLKLQLPHELQLIRFYVMRALSIIEADESRAIRWLPVDGALNKLSFQESRELVRAAEIALRKGE